MLQGEVLRDGWHDENVKRSLDLCLSCKACKSECPANVDLATYRAEFLSHYYENKSRPLHAHIFGKIDQWARLASAAPSLINFINNNSLLRPLINNLLRFAPQRRIPQFARMNFRSWLSKRGPAPDDSDATRTEVFLWLDTFNNYFHPETSRAALEVLEHAGFRVTTSTRHLCCGRPLYDFGMLDDAKKYLTRILDALKPQLDAGTPVVVLEPSCASVFRDELVNLFPNDLRAKKLRSQTFLLSEFLQRFAPNFQPGQLTSRVLVHGHCHHKALMKMTDEEVLLRKTGTEIFAPDTGCCGMAGAFGFEKEKFALSQRIGERVLLPAVRKEAPETLLVADGFSCREQITQATGRPTLHLAEVLRMALQKTRES
jgi:Fe-S oxidoreductase